MQIELSEGEVGQRLGACSLSPVGEREGDGREETLHTVAEVAGTPWYCRAMRARLVDAIPARISDVSHK